MHPDGSRIATGGLDAKIRIWSTKPILNTVSEQTNRPPKSLCTLTMHTGPVLCVRWANSGRWLASGSDDEIVMVWDLDPFVFPFFPFGVFPKQNKNTFAAPREAKYGAQMRSMSRVGNR